ncbi:MAG: hypothetical protein SOZ80_08020 [Prevotella sp.]|uniref:hypothetical protein n=1 Tax=Prevotella sp. TaxID=59823 RepID=UPI002A31590A|nr:hypothetical protein [Prevotella sp.]MDD7317789.1 hypothetical protein [Prevotellaceae bacterium]MDY4020704.1 hypothetical protein [Prevotella sp.]
MKKEYIKPESSYEYVELQYHLMDPSTWSMDGGDKIPISEDDSDDEPSGAKGFDFYEENGD